MNDNGQNTKTKTKEMYRNQIAVLRSLYSREPASLREPRVLQIEEIAQRSGLKDERETQRYLFILEGQKLVTPHPSGDFTSKNWQITDNGISALRTIERSSVTV